MPNIDLSILNQRQTPAFFADTLANRPAAGFLGRIFVSTDTFAFYRDNGSGWDLIGGPGTGTITGSGANGQIALWNGASTIVGDSGLTYDGTANSLTASKYIVTGGTSTQFLKGDGSLDSNTYNTGSGSASQVAFFSGTNAITGENNLWWDSTNNHFGINTNIPGTALDIHHDQSTLVQLNQTTATNDTRLAFQNSGTALWRIGNFYNAGANDWGIFDVVGAIQPLTIKKTTGQTFIGAQTTSSGRLVVNDATGDNHIVVIGATAPSLRINNSGSGATKQIGIGLATATNNFIQGAVDRDMAIFNGSTTPSPILFGIYGTTNIQEAARISAARNFLIGTTTDGGQRLQISGSARATGYYLDGMTAGSGALYYNSGQNRVTLANYNASGILLFEVNGGNASLTLNSDTSATFVSSVATTGGGFIGNMASTNNPALLINRTSTGYNGIIKFSTGANDTWILGNRNTSDETFRLYNYNVGADVLTVSNDGNIGINVSSPTILLDLLGRGISPVLLRLSNPNPNCDITIQSSLSTYVTRLRQGSDDFQVYVNNSATPNLKITSTGNLLIGTTTDTGQKLQVNGNIVSQSTGNPFFGSQKNGGNQYGFYSDGAGSLILVDFGVAVRGNFNMGSGVYTATSDINKKKDFELSNLGLDAILGLKPTLYRMKEDKEDSNKYLGFLAQEVKEFIPQSFVEKDDFIGLDYQPIVATLVKAIQELNTKIENLKN